MEQAEETQETRTWDGPPMVVRREAEAFGRLSMQAMCATGTIEGIMGGAAVAAFSMVNPVSVIDYFAEYLEDARYRLMLNQDAADDLKSLQFLIRKMSAHLESSLFKMECAMKEIYVCGQELGDKADDDTPATEAAVEPEATEVSEG